MGVAATGGIKETVCEEREFYFWEGKTGNERGCWLIFQAGSRSCQTGQVNQKRLILKEGKVFGVIQESILS